MDEPFYFGDGASRLFGLYFPARGQPRGSGIVLCNGFGKEYEISRTPLCCIARELASSGFPCLRFDYGGYGDSAGEFADATVTSMCADIEAAIGELQRRANVASVGLLGVRLGATLSALVAARLPSVSSLVLWEPLPRPWDVLYDQLRHSVTMQMLLFREVRFTRDQILENVAKGQPSLSQGYDLSIIDEGFPLSAALVDELKDVDLVARPPATRANTLVVNIVKAASPVDRKLQRLADALRAQGAPCVLEQALVPCLPWVHEKVFATRFPELFATTLRWMESR